MDISNLRALFIFLIQLTACLNAIDFDDGCFLEEPASLQVAFAMDGTGTFLIAPNNKLSFFKEFAALAPQLMEAIDQDYPGSQFALTTHADWQVEAKPKFSKGTSLHSLREGCYTLRTRFTTDRKLFQSQMLKVKSQGSGQQENALSALAFTAADTKIGWIRGPAFPNGKLVRRVLILVTDEDDIFHMAAPNVPIPRHEFKGDGTDLCYTSKPPGHKILKEVLEKYQMTVISLLAENAVRKNLTALYKQHFEEMGANIKYCQRAFVLKNNRILLTDEELKEKDAPGFWSDEINLKAIEDLEDSSNDLEPLKGKEAEIAELSEKQARAGKYDDLIKYIKSCLKETNSNACIFGDPDGFNTLGF